MSESVLKTLACRGLRVGPSKPESKVGLAGKTELSTTPQGPNFGRSREGYGRYDLPMFSRNRVSIVDLGAQSSILLSGGGSR